MGLWKNRQDEADRKAAEQPPPPVKAAPAAQAARPAPKEGRAVGGETEMANIGKSISIKGDVEGGEDTVIEGRVEGRVSLKSHHLTIGPNGEVQGEVAASQVTVVGKVMGNVIATERIEIRDSGRVEGDLVAPRLAVAEGAWINGAIKMKQPGAIAAAQPEKKKPEERRPPAPPPA